MNILNILLGILLFFIIILVHEFGHFIVAKLCNMKIKEFAIGMGPKLFQKQAGETVFAFRALPIGGSVTLDEDVQDDDPRSFRNRPVWMRILVIAAGAFMNFVLGFIFCLRSVLCSSSVGTTTLAGFQEGAISSSVLQADDKILKINGMDIFTTMDISFQLTNSKARDEGSQYYTYDFVVERNGEIIELNDVKFASRSYAKLIANYKSLTEGKTGYAALPGEYFDIATNSYTEAFTALQQSDSEFAEAFRKIAEEYKSTYATENNSLYLDFTVYGESHNFFNVISAAGANFLSYGRLIWISLGNLLTGTYGLNEISGPIGVVQSVSVVASFGWGSLMTLAALVAINVGIVNLLPIPAMDGARLLFLFIELIRRKPVKAEHEGMVHFIGIVALMVLMVIVTFNDIIRIITGG